MLHIQDIKEATVTPESKYCPLLDVGQQQRVFRWQTAPVVVKRERPRRGRPASNQSRPHVVQLVVQRLQSGMSRAGDVQRGMRAAARRFGEGQRPTAGERRAVCLLRTVRSMSVRTLHRPRPLRHQVRQPSRRPAAAR